MTWYAVERKGPYDKTWQWDMAFKSLKKAKEHVEMKQPSFPKCRFKVVRYRKDKEYE